MTVSQSMLFSSHATHLLLPLGTTAGYSSNSWFMYAFSEAVCLDWFPNEKEQRLKAHFNFKVGVMKSLTLHVLLNTPKPHRKHINLLHEGTFEDVNLIRVLKTTQAFPHCNLLTVDLMDASCDLCLVSL